MPPETRLRGVIEAIWLLGNSPNTAPRLEGLTMSIALIRQLVLLCERFITRESEIITLTNMIETWWEERISEDGNKLIRERYRYMPGFSHKNERTDKYEQNLMPSDLDVFPRNVRMLIATYLDSFLLCQLELHKYIQSNTIEFYRNRKLYQLLMVQYEDVEFPNVRAEKKLLYRNRDGTSNTLHIAHYLPREDLPTSPELKKTKYQNLFK